MFRGSTILHGPDGEPYYVSDSGRGIRRAKRRGATAIDLNIRTCLSDDKKSRVVVVAHWDKWWQYGFMVKPGHSVPRKPISRLTISQVRGLVSKRNGYQIITAQRAMDVCKQTGITPFFEMKPSKWDTKCLAEMQAYAVKIGINMAVMTEQSYGRTRAGRALWERAALARMTKAHAVGIPTMLLYRRAVNWAKWGPVLSAIKGHRGHGATVSLGGSTRGATQYGCSVVLSNARYGTRKVRSLMRKADAKK